MSISKNVLIVEDEPLIAMMLEGFLEMMDHRVAGSADSVSSALDLLNGIHPDAAILDMNLAGGESSMAVAEELDRRGIPFVIASGGNVDDGENVFRGRPRLLKPFTMDRMSKAIDAL